MRALAVFFVLGILSVTILKLSAQQTDAHYSVHARILDDIYHQGAPGVRVTLSGAGLKQPTVVVTGESGAFGFTSLVAGTYRIAVDSASFFAQGYPEVTVGGTTDLELGDLILVKKRQMRGTVKWSDGEPVAGAFVQVMGFRGAGYSRPPQVIVQTTNDRGEFAFPNVQPRHYIVFAYLPVSQGSPDLAPRMGPLTFYPSGSSPESATILSMRTTPEFQMNIVLDEQPPSIVEGMVSSSYFPAGTQVQLGLVSPGVAMENLATVVTRVGDPFQFPAVPPGNYLILANARRINNSQQEESLDLIPFQVERGRSIQGMNVMINEPLAIKGKAEIEESDPQAAGSGTGTSLNAKLTAPPQFGTQFQLSDALSYGLAPGRFDQNGDFRSSAAARGEKYYISAGMNLPCDCYIARMTQGDKDLMAGALPIAPGGDPFHMTLRKDGGRLQGSVSEGDKVPQKAFVVLAPEKRRMEYWYRKVYTLPDGSYKLANIAPGEYDLFAFDRDEDTQYLDDKFLGKYAATAVHVKIKANDNQSANVKMVRLP